MFCGSNDVTKIIQYLDLNKAHGDDVICISMLKICGESVSKTLNLALKKFQFIKQEKPLASNLYG